MVKAELVEGDGGVPRPGVANDGIEDDEERSQAGGLNDARRLPERWRIHSDTGRLHRAPDLLTPQQFAGRHEATSTTRLSA